MNAGPHPEMALADGSPEVIIGSPSEVPPHAKTRLQGPAGTTPRDIKKTTALAVLDHHSAQARTKSSFSPRDPDPRHLDLSCVCSSQESGSLAKHSKPPSHELFRPSVPPPRVADKDAHDWKLS